MKTLIIAATLWISMEETIIWRGRYQNDSAERKGTSKTTRRTQNENTNAQKNQHSMKGHQGDNKDANSGVSFSWGPHVVLF